MNLLLLWAHDLAQYESCRGAEQDDNDSDEENENNHPTRRRILISRALLASVRRQGGKPNHPSVEWGWTATRVHSAFAAFISNTEHSETDNQPSSRPERRSFQLGADKTGQIGRRL